MKTLKAYLVLAASAGALLAPQSALAQAFNPTPNGDPFPIGSAVDLTGNFTTPYGVVHNITLSNLGLPEISFSGGNEIFNYTQGTFTAQVPEIGPVVVVAQDVDFNVTVENRSSLFSTGTFSALINDATFTGTLLGYTLVTSIASAGPGTAIYQNVGGVLEVETAFTVPGQYSVDGGPPQSAGNINVDSAVAPGPVPGAGLAALAALALAGLYAKTRRA
jgi:hypothetical protein